MRVVSLLCSFVLFACAGAPAEPATPEPERPEPTTPEPSTPEVETPEAPAPEADAAPSPEPPQVDSCQEARDRIAECAKKDELAEATANECRKELASAPKAAEELARCLGDLGCKALAKSKSTRDGALGICFVAAKRKQLDPATP
jgi:hypothetical protein